MSIQKHFAMVDLVVEASIQSSLDLIDQIKDKWSTTDLSGVEERCLTLWHDEAVSFLMHYLIMLSDARAEDDGKVDLQLDRIFPRIEHNRLVTYLGVLISTYGPDCSTGHDMPHNLPLFTRGRSAANLQETKHLQFSLSPIVIDNRLAVLGDIIFLQGLPDLKRSLLAEKRVFRQAQASIKPNGWEHLRMQLAVTFDSAWDQLTFSDQAMVDNDLSRLPSQVERHVRTVSGFRTYIEDCVAEQSRHGHHIVFQRITRKLLLESSFFGSVQERDTASLHANSSNCTILSLRKRAIYHNHRG